MTHVAVIGCGVVGAAIAYELSLVPGMKVTVIDRQEPATGATGAALGVLMGIISQKVKGRSWQLRQASMQRYETLIPELEAIADCHIPFNRQGILKLCFAGEDMTKWEKLSQTRRTQGWQLEILHPKDVRARYPQLADLDLVGAVYSPQDRQVDPVALTRALVAAGERKRIAFQFGVTVEAVRYTIDRDTKVGHTLETNRGSLDVDAIVVAAGLGSTPLTANLAPPVEMIPVLGQALQLRLGNPMGDPERQPVITGDDVHIVPCEVGVAPIVEYWVGATVEFPQNGEVVEGDPELLEQVRRRAIAFCPILARATLVSTWSGLRPRPQRQPAPIIGHLEGFSNVILATGHYRNGVLLAPATALEVRKAIASS